MTVRQQQPERTIIVANRMAEAQSWARRNGLPFGSIIWVEPDGSDRTLRVLHGTERLPYVELTPARGQTAVMLDVQDHYRIGGV